MTLANDPEIDTVTRLQGGLWLVEFALDYSFLKHSDMRNWFRRQLVMR